MTEQLSPDALKAPCVCGASSEAQQCTSAPTGMTYPSRVSVSILASCLGGSAVSAVTGQRAMHTAMHCTALPPCVTVLLHLLRCCLMQTPATLHSPCPIVELKTLLLNLALCHLSPLSSCPHLITPTRPPPFLYSPSRCLPVTPFPPLEYGGVTPPPPPLLSSSIPPLPPPSSPPCSLTASSSASLTSRTTWRMQPGE